MVEVFEITRGGCERVFALYENGEIGRGVLALNGCCVVIKDIVLKDGISANYFDLLARSLLNVIRNMPAIRVKTNIDYFAKFGFIKTAEGLETTSDKIELKGECCNA